MSVPLGRQGGKERAACEMVGPNVFTYTHTHTHKFTHTHTHTYIASKPRSHWITT